MSRAHHETIRRIRAAVQDLRQAGLHQTAQLLEQSVERVAVDCNEQEENMPDDFGSRIRRPYRAVQPGTFSPPEKGV